MNKNSFQLIVFVLLSVTIFYSFETNSSSHQKNIIVNPYPSKSPKDTITLGGGCFWCMEAIFRRIKGVESVESGFSGGFVNNPSYRDVCTKNTGHAEVVQIIFNPNQVSLEEILKIFFYSHDPTSINKQGDDIGDQYRSIAFYRNKYQFQVLNAMIVALNRSNVFSNSIQTKIEQFKVFFKAEEYHQGYYEYNRETPYCKKIIQPKIQKIEIDFKKNIKN